MKEKQSWAWEIGIALLFGVPIYWGSFVLFGFPITFLLHAVFVGFYGLLILIFGRGSGLEMGCIVMALAINLALVCPIIHYAMVKNAKQQEKTLPERMR